MKIKFNHLTITIFVVLINALFDNFIRSHTDDRATQTAKTEAKTKKITLPKNLMFF